MFNVNKPKEKLILNDDVDEDLIQEDHEVQQALIGSVGHVYISRRPKNYVEPKKFTINYYF